MTKAAAKKLQAAIGAMSQRKADIGGKSWKNPAIEAALDQQANEAMAALGYSLSAPRTWTLNASYYDKVTLSVTCIGCMVDGQEAAMYIAEAKSQALVRFDEDQRIAYSRQMNRTLSGGRA